MSAKDRQEGGNHYKKYKIQPYDFIMENGLSYLQGNVIKYILRYKDKHPDSTIDLEKVIHYCQLEIERIKPSIQNGDHQ
jgi:hypothetical protein